MATIWKYPFSTQGELTIDMPEGAKVLSLQVQNGAPCLWALVRPEKKVRTRYFRVFGTGHPIELKTSFVFIGTYQLDWLVFHVFEDTKVY